MKLPSVSAIIPVHNGEEKFRQCLASVAAAHPQPEELIVVSDGSTDGSGKFAEETGARVIWREKAGGPAKARNVGAQAASGEILFFLDADVTVPPDIFGQVKEIFAEAPDLTAAIGSYDEEPSETNFLSQYKNLMHHYVHQIGNEEAFTFWGACGAIRKEAYLEMGGYDEGYTQPSIEDIELGYRLKAAGHRIKLVHDLQVKHLKRWEAGSLLKTDFLRRALPWSELILRRRGFANDLNIDLGSRASVALVYLLLGTAVGGVWWAWLWTATAACGIALLAVNRHVYRFFTRKRGIWFAIRTIPWHWLYYLYSGLGFAMALVRVTLSRKEAGNSKLLLAPRENHE